MITLAQLLVQHTKEQVYALALAVAASVGLNTSSWQPGDPTRSLFHVEAETLAGGVEAMVVGFIASGFLDYATGGWLTILAKQVYNVDRPDATYAEGAITLSNAGGGFYDAGDLAAGNLTFKSSLSGKTYHNTSSGVLNSGPGTSVTLDLIADEPGTDSSAGAGEIDTMVTTLLGVTCSNAAAVVGTDAQPDEVTRQQCRDKLGSFSPNGPKEAYSYVARNSALTGTNVVTRVRVYADSTNGQVLAYLAGASGAIGSSDVDLVTTAIETWATPLCITPTVLSAIGLTVDVSYELWLYKSCNKTTVQVAADVQTALEAMLSLRPIGGDIIPPAASGALYVSMLESTIRGVFSQAFRCNVTAPAATVALTNGQVAELGAVTATIHLVDNP